MLRHFIYYLGVENIKVHEESNVAPPPSSTQSLSLPFTLYDTLFLRFPSIDWIFFYSLNAQQSEPSFFYANVIPKLKASLSHTLLHYPPLAGNILWPSDSTIPIISYTPGDAVSVVVAESNAEFNHFIDYSVPHEATESRFLVPHLESSDSRASALALQITLFPNKGFSIGISIHHAAVDGRSSTMFIKAWASLCQQIIMNYETTSQSVVVPSLVPELEPSFDRTLIKDPGNWNRFLLAKWCPNIANGNSDGDDNGKRTVKILPSPPRLKEAFSATSVIKPTIEEAVRATFVLTREDLEKIKKRVFSKWDQVKDPEPEPESESESKSTVNSSSKPPTLSSFVLACAYSVVCIAKAVHGVEKEKQKFGFWFPVDYRARLEPPIPDTYFGNCVWSHLVDAEPLDFIKEEGLVLVAKSINRKVKTLHKEEVFGKSSSRFMALAKEGAEMLGVSMSNKFMVYETDFGWGKPAKVDIINLDRASNLTMGLLDSKDGDGGVEVGLVMHQKVMDLFGTIFHGGLKDE